MLLSFLLVFMLLFAFLQVVLRNFFDSGVSWGDVFNRSMVLWIGFLGATIAAKENRHLSLEVLTSFLPAKVKPYIAILVNIFVAVVCAFLTKASCLFFQDQIAFESEDLLFTGFPKPYLTVIFPIGFGLLTFRYLVKIVESFYVMGGGSLNAQNQEHYPADISVKTKIDQVE